MQIDRFKGDLLWICSQSDSLGMILNQTKSIVTTKRKALSIIFLCSTMMIQVYIVKSNYSGLPAIKKLSSIVSSSVEYKQSSSSVQLRMRSSILSHLIVNTIKIGSNALCYLFCKQRGNSVSNLLILRIFCATELKAVRKRL